MFVMAQEYSYSHKIKVFMDFYEIYKKKVKHKKYSWLKHHIMILLYSMVKNIYGFKQGETHPKDK